MLLLRTKLFETIRVMTDSERDRIADFISSSVFLKKKGKIFELYTLLREEVEKYERDEPFIETEEEIYFLLSPVEWNQKTFDSMESRLLNVIKKVIVYLYAGIDKLELDMTKEEERHIEIKQHILLAKFYSERKLNQQFENTINKLKILQNTPPYYDDDYYNRYLIALAEYDFSSIYRMSNRHEKRATTLENLDLHYTVQKLAILLQCEPPIEEEIEFQLQNLENLSINKNPLLLRIIELYRKTFYLICSKDAENETALETYLETLETDAHLLPIEQQKNLYTYARNFCTAQYKKGKNHYLKILFELIKKNLKAGLMYYQNGVVTEGITFGAFQNIVAIGLKLHESDWVYTFLNEHKTKIIAPNATEQERFYHFSLACYHFQRKEYEEARKLLKTDFDDERYRLRARALEIKLYFEKNDKKDKEIEFLEKRIAAFETYLSRNEIPPLDRIGYRNFIKLIKKLNKQKPITRKDLREKDSIAEREWIIEKIQLINDVR